MEIAEITSKTLEFPYGSLSGLSVSGMLGSSKTAPKPSLNQPSSDSSGRTLPMAETGQFPLNPVCHTLRLSHSGFLSIFFTDFRNRPF